MPVVDASFLVAAWAPDHAQHKDARQRLADLTAARVPIRVNAGALVEAAQIIRRLAKDAGLDGSKEARAFLDSFLHLPGTSLASEHLGAAVELYMDETALSLADAWVAMQCRQGAEEVLSYDRKVLQAAKQR